MSNPTLIMLVGVPASGKSTWINEFVDHQECTILSTDDYIQGIANTKGKTYNEVFQTHIKEATKWMNDIAKYAFFNDRNVVWDQTNLTAKSRKAKLEMVPKHYKKIAVYFETPNAEEHKRRLESRPGKTIPAHILKNMIESTEIPSHDEGFDNVLVYKELENEV